MLPASHLEDALSRIQRIVTLASQPEPPVTEHEAFEQVVEELELAGFGAPRLDAALLEAERELDCLPA
jgi:hypothetical protein